MDLTPRITVVIPTWNAGPELEDVLAAVQGQAGSFSLAIQVIDSSSTDGTPELLRRLGLSFQTIPQSAFDHGATRMVAAERAEADYVAFLSQDAMPRDERWLAELLAPLRQDASAVASYARQIPREDAHAFQTLNQSRHLGEDTRPRHQGPVDRASWDALGPQARLDLIRFDNVSSLIRRDVLVAHPFPRAAFGEDVAWARSRILEGSSIIYAPGAVVVHSHAVTRAEFSDRVEQHHAVLRRLTDFRPIPSRGLLWRRTLGTILRFWRALIRSPQPRGWARAGWFVRAPVWAWRQMSAMRRGSEAARYEAPDKTSS